MNEELLNKLLREQESSVLDFKRDMYSFENDFEGSVSKLIKDILSFCNTIREKKAYIIFGIEENENKIKIKKGIEKIYDDSFFHDKIKNKIFPLPRIKYYNIRNEELNFGILEFPLVKYNTPIYSTVKLKGIDV
ncbi:MAG: putative DNA binding domain-containing protein, partial [Bacteroidetes bacterium]|nr:putative DNA binding domain-containing protein [Bacteroidota bacterium]